ncbi:hypothetical protein SAMN05216553_102120 [Lentzea fradiae]|uniref:Uncharacterized protein n=1 Tax=Lentzea fradiae TaxID=200378 RepID=A0A1G7M6G8_9PSEU|nr:hypothetical protein SAMN05216553_102120 [Lentzea fradiae]
MCDLGPRRGAGDGNRTRLCCLETRFSAQGVCLTLRSGGVKDDRDVYLLTRSYNPSDSKFHRAAFGHWAFKLLPQGKGSRLERVPWLSCGIFGGQVLNVTWTTSLASRTVLSLDSANRSMNPGIRTHCGALTRRRSTSHVMHPLRLRRASAQDSGPRTDHVVLPDVPLFYSVALSSFQDFSCEVTRSVVSLPTWSRRRTRPCFRWSDTSCRDQEDPFDDVRNNQSFKCVVAG